MIEDAKLAEVMDIIAAGIALGVRRDGLSLPDGVSVAAWAAERARNIGAHLQGVLDGDTLEQLGATMREHDLHLTIQPGKRFVVQVVMGMPPRRAAVKTGDTLTEAIERGLEESRKWLT